MNDSKSMITLSDFKTQVDMLSESFNHFGPVERSKALEFLQECIEDLQKKNISMLTEEDLADGTKIETTEEEPVVKENDGNYSILQEDICLQVCEEKYLSVVQINGCSDSSSYEEMEHVISSTNQVDGSVYTSSERCCEELNTSIDAPNEKIEDDASEYNLPSDEDCGSRSDDDCKSVLKCPKCEEQFNNKQRFLEHLQSYPGKVKSCLVCHKMFQNSIAFKSHKQLEMCLKSNKMYKCKLCNKTLYGQSQYKTHLSAHSRNQCKICGDHFARKKHLEAHSVNVHNASFHKDLFRCHVCERTFTQRRSLVYHYKITHPDSSHICSICLEMFDSSAELDTHRAAHKQETFTCDKCSAQFSRRQQYLVHMKEHERYKCVTCDESFSAKKEALKHARQGHKVSGLECQMQCAECGELFCSKALLNTHMILHTGGKNLACEKCKITFKHERNYISHLETNEHLRGEEVKNLLACTDCDKTFTNKNNLRVHVSRMHKAGVKEHTCTHCSYKTISLTNLKRHVALHTEKPRFICDKCGLQLQTKSALQEHHVHIHSDSKEFSCDKCGKMFGRSSDLKRHLLNIHSDTPVHTCNCGNKYKSLSNLKRHQLLSHGKVDIKQKRLQKLFQVESSDPPKKKLKKIKVKTQPDSTDGDDLQFSQIPGIVENSSEMTDTKTLVMMAERHPEEILEVSYNMDFAGDDDKSHVIYAQNLDMGGLQVVESMIQLENDPSKQASVLINVRNLFGRSEYIVPSPLDSPMVNGLGGSLTEVSHHIPAPGHKRDVISGLQEYVLHQDLNFL